MSPTEKGTAAVVTCLAVVVDFTGRRCVERRAVGQARDRRGGESCHCIFCRLTIVAIVEPRGGRRHQCELAGGEREPTKSLLSRH
ncbi:hypothetical protein AHAS_Ahas11G0195600 [Arachis hypogaea]